MIAGVRSLYGRFPRGFRDRVRWVKRPVDAWVSALIYRSARRRVVSGPFAGMALAGARPHLPYVLGTQELELHPVIGELARRPFDQIVNIGAGDGYYAIGMALCCPSAQVIAFESEPDKRAALGEAAQANGVAERVRIRGTCTRADLDSVLAPARSTLLIVDVEGGEVDLLDPDALGGLRQATILVETHDLLVPGCAATMRRRFSATHSIRTYGTRPRTREDFPLKSALLPSFVTGRVVLGAMFEGRLGPQEWLLLEPGAQASVSLVPSGFVAQNRQGS